ncbi:hypothetical protein JCM8097_000150 [Rhodosporidiobolus ruineniae]
MTSTPPPESPFPPRPSTNASASASSSSAPSGAPITAKPIPVEWPLTSFASTPHNVACIAFVLGAAWAAGLALVVPNLASWFRWQTLPSAAALPAQGWWTTLTASPQLGSYVAAVAVFHLLEFVVTSMFNPGKLSVASYLLNNGAAYHVAHFGGLVEYILEERYFPAEYRLWKHSGHIFVLGLFILVAGQILRSFAMISAAGNFSHLYVLFFTSWTLELNRLRRLAYTKRPDHQLVKTGIYSWSRHPSYAGFYWWAVGTQLVLGNPICTLIFLGVLHWFFRNRIEVEEKYLVKFFGSDYEQYRARVPSRILFVP